MHSSIAILATSLVAGSYAAASSIVIGLSSASTSAGPIYPQTTVGLIVGNIDFTYVGSVVAADACDTTMASRCLGGGESKGYLSFTQTYRPGVNSFTIAVTTDGATGDATQTCSMSGTTSAVCVATLSLEYEGQSTQTTVTTTTTDADQLNKQIPITAGASKLKGLASCTSTANAAPAATAFVDVYKVLFVPGAAALLAGANAML